MKIFESLIIVRKKERKKEKKKERKTIGDSIHT
jgi:hypothetical protein